MITIFRFDTLNDRGRIAKTNWKICLEIVNFGRLVKRDEEINYYYFTYYNSFTFEINFWQKCYMRRDKWNGLDDMNNEKERYRSYLGNRKCKRGRIVEERSGMLTEY